MRAFVLETLTGRDWKRGGRIYWTVESARNQARRLVNANKAVAVQILGADVELTPVDGIPCAQEGAYDEN